VKWSLDQEERWRKADAERETQGAKLEEQWRHRERRLVIILAIIGSILTAIQIVADVVISLK
jgi:hypothetical protein